MRGHLPQRTHDIVVLKAFADARDLSVGDRVEVVIRGRRIRLRISGIGMSPDYVFAMEPGSTSSDPSNFGAIWMNYDLLAEMLGRKGHVQRSLG